MQTLNWDRFQRLDGDPRSNWERLCTETLRRTYTSLGRFESYSQQPGVELILVLERKSPTLGDPPRQWGWQCRWYDLPSGRSIGANRRSRIEQAIRKTEKFFPATTDWVLWTRHPLTPTDQSWFYGMSTPMDLRLWSEVDLVAHLIGEAAILRETYFGDLVLAPETMRDLRTQSIAPVVKRWMPEVHVEVSAERTIRKILGDPTYWPEVSQHARALSAPTAELAGLINSIEPSLRAEVSVLHEDLRSLSEQFQSISQNLEDGELSKAIQTVETEWLAGIGGASARRLARGVRRKRSEASLSVQAALAHHHDAARAVAKIRNLLSTRLIAVVGPAGSGKTQLAAQLSAEAADRPCGIYLEASRLERNGSVQDLVRWMIDRSLSEILEGLEAAGVRSGVRIPVIIDGLNESEDPVVWKRELATLQVMLHRFCHVVVIVTTRPQVAKDVLPEDCAQIELKGFDALTDDAVARYFRHYRIDSSNIRIPIALFRRPLFLRIFCEAVNPDREASVRPEAIPDSLLEAFARFRKIAIERIANRTSRMRRYDQDIFNAVDSFALWLWDNHSRFMPFDEFRLLIADDGSDWNESLARALRDEGIVSMPSPAETIQRAAVLYDGLAGFLVADALVRRMGKTEFQTWLRDDRTLISLGCNPEEVAGRRIRLTRASTKWLPKKLRERIWRFFGVDPGQLRAHPLAVDIRESLAGLVPRKFRMQLWQHVSSDLRGEALAYASNLERSLLDKETVNEIGRVAMLQPSVRRPDLLNRFREVRDVVGHPLNAEFLDGVLSVQTVASRDLRWSEWIRRSEDTLVSDIRALAEDWQASSRRMPQDHLRARWVKWHLTSTLRDLRDHATHALYWYGRGDPKALFELTIASLKVNDPYVPERLLAATYGVVMAASGEKRDFDDELARLLDCLWKALCSKDPESPTHHWLIREYVAGVAEVARRYFPISLGRWACGQPFARPDYPEAIARDDVRTKDRDLIYGFDFANYTLGRLVPDRGNYQYDHPVYQEVLSWIRGRVWDLGWRFKRFESTEKMMAQLGRNYDHRSGRLELYLKKYGWIGFFEAAGRLQDEGRSPLSPDEFRLSDVDIDPSFPEVPHSDQDISTGWLSQEQFDLQNWVTSGNVDVPDILYRCQVLRDQVGPWVVLSGYLLQEDVESRRRVFGFLHGIFVRRNKAKKLKSALSARLYPGNHWIPPAPEDYYLFAGEIPWSSNARRGLTTVELSKLYAAEITLPSGQSITVQIPNHSYNWESYHSSLNQAGGHPVPAITFAEAFDLRVAPNSLNWCDPDGRPASMTLRAPPDFKHGHLLYLREDFIREYCDKHDFELVWIIWGERESWFADHRAQKPAWVTQAYSNYSHIWRHVTTLSDLASP